MNILNKTKKTALIQGGPSIEREISLITGQNVAQSFNQLDIPFTTLEADINLYEKLLQFKPDQAFLAVHGPYGEDGTLQGLLEHLKIPYTGSGVLSSALCMDKVFLKKLLHQHQISTAPYIIINILKKHSSLEDFYDLEKNILQHIQKEILKTKNISIPPFLPCIVKPCRSGSSIGVHHCRFQQDWKNAFESALKIDHQILIEKYIEGSEVAVSYLDGQILTPVEIQTPQGHFYDFKRKYEKNQTQYFVPPRLNLNTIEKLKTITDQIQKLCQIKSYCRVDFIIDKKENIYVLELNTLPGLTPLSLLPMSAKYDGISYNDLILKILENANLDYS